MQGIILVNNPGRLSEITMSMVCSFITLCAHLFYCHITLKIFGNCNIIEIQTGKYFEYFILYDGMSKNFTEGNSFCNNHFPLELAAIRTQHPLLIRVFIIGIHLVACPIPQSNGATRTILFFMSLG